MNTFEYKRHIEKLKQSPVFALTLGSKELFHSNFWKYLMDTKEFDQFIKMFFESIDLSNGYIVEREKKHMDLVITTSDKKYVIENKIKSYPDKQQLIKYTNENNISIGVITGIKEPSFKLPEPWIFKSYLQISHSLRSIKPKDVFLANLLEKYCDVLESINFLMNESMDEMPNRLSFWTENTMLLNDINMMDVYRKLRGDDFVHFLIDNNIEEIFNSKADELSDGWSFSIDRSFHNAKTTLNFKFIKRTLIDKKYISEIGVQIEHNQFRLFFGVDGVGKNQIFENGIAIGWFNGDFNKKPECKVIDGKKSSMTIPYCSYGNQWIYQYFDITDEFNDYESLLNLITEKLNMIYKIIKENEKKLFK